MSTRSAKVFLWSAVAVAVVVLAAGVAFCSDWHEERRDRWLQPDRVMDAVGVRSGMTIGEVGAGDGYFTVKLARRVGPEGHVYANDISTSRLQNLSDRAAEEGLETIVTVLGEEEDPDFPVSSLEMVFFVYSLHDIDSPVALLRNLRRYLVENATVVVLDQDPAISGDDHFLPFERVTGILGEAGYELLRREEFLERDLLCVFGLRASGKAPAPGP